jgi:hypothetical protein
VGLVIYALILSAVVFTGFGQFLDDFGGEERLIVISDARLSDIQVTYGGREVRPRPGFLPSAELTHVLFGPMRTRWGHEPVLTVTWQAVSGERRSVSQVLGNYDSEPICLFVLKLDADAKPINHHPESGIVPFSVSCHWK